LIDEVFRGTNSRDRLIGARNVLNNLSKGWVIGLISTHDLELCDLEHSNIKIKNYHFTESFTENQIVFDYNLRLGCSHTTNAQYLMKMVGINILD
jgi:DNA mismatch repair ATPase MutS